jgi:hypothetical protein
MQISRMVRPKRPVACSATCGGEGQRGGGACCRSLATAASIPALMPWGRLGPHQPPAGMWLGYCSGQSPP